MMNKLFGFGLGLLMTLNLFAPLPAFAADVRMPEVPQPEFLPGPEVGETGNETQDYILNETIPQAINIVIGILGIAAFLGILIAAIQMLTAYGNDDKVEKAKTNIKYGVMGFVLAILSYAIVSIVSSIVLPNEDDTEAYHWLIPSAYAVDVDDVDILLPNQQDVIEAQDEQGRVGLPGGDFFGEIVPAVITNVMYVVGFLIFIAFMYGGVLLVIARGNEDAVGKAKNIVVYSALALALLSLGYAVIYGIANLNLNQDSTTESDDVFVDTEEAND